MRAPVGWPISIPSAAVEGVMYCMHGHSSDHRMASDRVDLPDVAAASPALWTTPGATPAIAFDGGSVAPAEVATIAAAFRTRSEAAQ